MSQRSLTALRIGNFKAFADTQRIPLKPITLIFGPNSAGKSSLIQSLALAHQAQLGRSLRGGSPLDVHSTEIGGKSIDLGGFRQFVHQRKANRRLTWGAELAVESLDKRLRELLQGVRQLSIGITIGIELDDQERAKPGASPRVESFEILADNDEIMYGSARRGNSDGTILRVDRLAVDHAVWKNVARAIVESFTTTSTLQEGDAPALDAAVADLLPKLDIRCPRLFPDSVVLRDAESDIPTSIGNLIPVSRGNRDEDLALAIRAWLPRVLNDLIGGVARALSGELATLRYLGPVRERPPRHVGDPDRRDTNWAAGGSFAWDALARDEGVRERVNQWLQGHPGKSTSELFGEQLQQSAKAIFDGEASNQSRMSWMKTPYRIVVERYTANDDVQKALATEFYEEQQTLEERRESLTSELAKLYAQMNGAEGTGRTAWDRVKQQLEPFVEDMASVESDEEATEILRIVESVLGPGAARFLESPEVMQEITSERQNRYGRQAMDADRRAKWFVDRLQKRDVANIDELRLWDQSRQTSVAICDVGFGISQVMPVLTLAYGSQNDLIAIEQPEIHLHPALQAELADVFIESALGKRQNTFILETHSEHVILRLLRRIRETTNGELPEGLQPLHPEDVQILYARPEGSGSRIIELAVDAEGEFVDRWPDGFFPDRAKELF